MHIQYEQERLISSYITAYDFIRQYNYVYDLQKNVPHKVFISSIIPLETFEVLFFQELFSIIETNDLHFNFNIFKKYSELLLIDYEYKDEELCEVIKKVYKRASNYFIDKIEDTEDAFVVSEIFYFFGVTNELIFMKFIFENNLDINGLIKNIIHLKNKFIKMNENYKRSFNIKENKKYDINIIVIEVNKRIKDMTCKMDKEEGYLMCMEYVSELVLHEIVSDDVIVEEMKIFAGDILKI